MPDDQGKPQDSPSDSEDEPMGDYYTGGGGLQQKDFGVAGSPTQRQQDTDSSSPGNPPPARSDAESGEGGQGGSQSGFGGYGSGPGSIERQAQRTDPADDDGKPAPDGSS